MKPLLPLILLTSSALDFDVPHAERVTVTVLPYHDGDPQPESSSPILTSGYWAVTPEALALFDGRPIRYQADIPTGVGAGGIGPEGSIISIANLNWVFWDFYFTPDGRPKNIGYRGHPQSDFGYYFDYGVLDDHIRIGREVIDGWEIQVPFSAFLGAWYDLGDLDVHDNAVQFGFEISPAESVPEPSAMWLAIMGVLAIGMVRR